MSCLSISQIQKRIVSSTPLCERYEILKKFKNGAFISSLQEKAILEDYNFNGRSVTFSLAVDENNNIIAYAQLTKEGIRTLEYLPKRSSSLHQFFTFLKKKIKNYEYY